MCRSMPRSRPPAGSSRTAPAMNLAAGAGRRRARVQDGSGPRLRRLPALRRRQGGRRAGGQARRLHADQRRAAGRQVRDRPARRAQPAGRAAAVPVPQHRRRDPLHQRPRPRPEDARHLREPAAHPPSGDPRRVDRRRDARRLGQAPARGGRRALHRRRRHQAGVVPGAPPDAAAARARAACTRTSSTPSPSWSSPSGATAPAP